MTLQSSGAISLDDIQTTFGGTSPISLSEYNRGGGLVASHGINMNIPATDSNLQLSDFYSAGKNFKTTVTSGTAVPSSTDTDTGFRSYAVGSNGAIGSVTGNLQIGFSTSNNSANGILTGYWQRATYRPKEGLYNYDLTFTVSSAANCATDTSWYSVGCGAQEILRATFTTIENNSWKIVNDSAPFTVSGDFVFKPIA